METQTRTAPLNVVRAPLADAVAGENLENYGGRTLAHLEWTHVYLGRWAAADRKHLDTAIPAAMTDARLNGVLVQYFPDAPVEAVFRGSKAGPVAPRRLDKAVVERIVKTLAVEGVATLLLPHGVVLTDGDVTSEHGLAGYHGSVGGRYYAVAVYSEGTNGIIAFDEPWKNICATVYHELQEVRTDPDVEDAIRTGDTKYLGWYSPRGGEIGDIPIASDDLHDVMREVPLASGKGTVPVQLMWSNKDEAPAAS
ncbi:MAG TPA: hypothetical protein VGK79_15590 [Gaiellaceae bacterium]|jgi:hypothetical protein